MKKAFFGKNSCLKIQENQGVVYFHMGKKNVDNWAWEKLKMSDVELGEIIRVLNGRSERWSTVHVFNKNQNKIWVDPASDGKAIFFKINDVTKAMSPGEQECMRILLEHCIVKTAER
ncbi:hypothetical protein K8R43_00195 [archaeon]|nr:hypothetical protein [archaeon]